MLDQVLHRKTHGRAEIGGYAFHVGHRIGAVHENDALALAGQRAELGIGLRGGDEHRVDVALDEFVDTAALALRAASRQVDDQCPFASGCSGFELVGEFGEVWVREVGHDDAECVRGAGLEGSGDGVGVVVEPLRRVEHPLRGVR